MTHEEIGQLITQMTAEFHPESVCLETERLLLRPMCEGDLEDLHSLLIQPLVAKMVGWKPTETMEESCSRLREYIADEDTLAVILKESGKLVGTISLQKRLWHLYPIDPSRKGRELGVALSRNFWGRGLMPEAIQALNRYCFDTLGYDFVTAGHFRENSQSHRVIEKCGFSYLFEDDRTLPTGESFHILTYIQWNPRKERKYV